MPHHQQHHTNDSPGIRRKKENPSKQALEPSIQTSGPLIPPGTFSEEPADAKDSPAARSPSASNVVMRRDGVMASPDGALSFLFGIFGLLVWYTSIRTPSSSELLTAGGLWLILSLGAAAASLLNMARGKLRGNINLLATLLLGLFPGINALVALGARLMGVPYSPRVLGLVYIIGSVFCLGMVVVRLDRPAYRSLGTLAIALGLLFLGLSDLTGQHAFRIIGGWCCFFFALYIFYFGLSVMYLFMDDSLPQGPILQRKGSRAATARYAYELDEEWEKAPAAHLTHFTNPAMILSFISAVFGLLNFVGAIWNMNPDEELAMGIIRLLLGSIHFMAALILLMQGNPYGNVTLIFAVCFALFSGGRKVLTVLESMMPVSAAPGLYGILQLFAGLYIALFLPAMKQIPVYNLISYWLSALGLMAFGLSELLSLPWLSILAGWMFLVFALLNVYKGISTMLPGLQQGPQWRGDPD